MQTCIIANEYLFLCVQMSVDEFSRSLVNSYFDDGLQKLLAENNPSDHDLQSTASQAFPSSDNEPIDADRLALDYGPPVISPTATTSSLLDLHNCQHNIMQSYGNVLSVSMSLSGVAQATHTNCNTWLQGNSPGGTKRPSKRNLDRISLKPEALAFLINSAMDKQANCCPFCDYTSSRKDNFTIHLRRHAGDNPFLCTSCGKGFASRPELSIHQKVHTGEREFPCIACGYLTNRKTVLRAHILKYHTVTASS